MFSIKRVQGRSMRPTLRAGQLLVFKRTKVFKPNQLVWARIDQRDVIKRLISLDTKGAYIQSDNSESLTYFVKLNQLKARLFFKLF